jgi:hypothetical protein
VLGDFDYNGFVDDDDVTLLGAFYKPTTSSATPSPVDKLIDLLAESIAAAGEAQPAGLPNRLSRLHHAQGDLGVTHERFFFRLRRR